MKQALSLLVFAGLFSGCALSKPCSNGGDTSWVHEFKGDKRCQKKTLKSVGEVNHGRYTAYYSSGRPALIGSFYDGKKHGIWSEYNEKGEKIMEKYFDHGVEKATSIGIESIPPPPTEEAK